MTPLSDWRSLHLSVTRRLGMSLQNTVNIRGSCPTTFLAYWHTTFMNSQINPLRLNETTPNFYGICIIMSRIHLCKKVNFVKNVTYEVLSRQRRYALVKRFPFPMNCPSSHLTASTVHPLCLHSSSGRVFFFPSRRSWVHLSKIAFYGDWYRQL